MSFVGSGSKQNGNESPAPRRNLLDRRKLLVGVGAGLVVAPAIIRSATAQPKEIVYSTYGGSWGAAIRKSWFDPFTAKTGIPVRAVTGGDNGKVRAMVRSGHTEWDIYSCNPDFQWIGAKEGLLEKLDFNVIDKKNFLDIDGFWTEFSAPEATWSKVIVYNTKRFPNGGPRNFTEFWDTKRFPGKRAMYTKANGATLEAALLADGVAPTSLYPIDTKRAFKSLDKIRDSILWFDNNTQALQFMEDGQAVLGVVPDGRAQFLIEKGVPIAIEYNQSLLTWVTVVIPKGASNRDGAMKLIAYLTSLDGQKAIGENFTYGLVDQRAYDLLPAERVKLLTNGPQQRGRTVNINERWWGENQARVEEEFAAWRLS